MFGADVNKSNLYGAPLHYTSKSGSLQIVRPLLDNGAKVDDQSNKFRATPLEMALHAGSYEVARLLLNRGANVEIKFRDDSTYRSSQWKSRANNTIIEQRSKYQCKKWLRRYPFAYSSTKT